MHNKFTKNIRFCFGYFYWHIILFNGRRCIKWINFPINILYFNNWKTKMPLMVFLYFYYTWMILKFPDNIIYWFVTYRLLRHNLLLIPKFFTIVSKYDLNVSATSLSSETTFLLLLELFFHCCQPCLRKKISRFSETIYYL